MVATLAVVNPVKKRYKHRNKIKKGVKSNMKLINRKRKRKNPAVLNRKRKRKNPAVLNRKRKRKNPAVLNKKRRRRPIGSAPKRRRRRKAMALGMPKKRRRRRKNPDVLNKKRRRRRKVAVAPKRRRRRKVAVAPKRRRRKNLSLSAYKRMPAGRKKRYKVAKGYTRRYKRRKYGVTQPASVRVSSYAHKRRRAKRRRKNILAESNTGNFMQEWLSVIFGGVAGYFVPFVTSKLINHFITKDSYTTDDSWKVGLATYAPPVATLLIAMMFARRNVRSEFLTAMTLGTGVDLFQKLFSGIYELVKGGNFISGSAGLVGANYGMLPSNVTPMLGEYYGGSSLDEIAERMKSLRYRPKAEGRYMSGMGEDRFLSNMGYMNALGEDYDDMEGDFSDALDGCMGCTSMSCAGCSNINGLGEDYDDMEGIGEEYEPLLADEYELIGQDDETEAVEDYVMGKDDMLNDSNTIGLGEDEDEDYTPTSGINIAGMMG